MNSNGMIRKNGTMFASLAVTVTLALVTFGAPAAWGQAGDGTRVDKPSRSSFSDTFKKLEATLKAEHMMVVAKIDHKNMLSMVGAKIKGSTTVEFGNPNMGKMLLPMDLAIGLEMPAKIYVYETSDNRVIVSFRKVAAQYASYGNPEVAKAGEMMDMMLDKITSAVTQ